MTGDIERVDTVERVASLATATTVEALPVPPGASADEADGGLDVRRLIENLDEPQTPDDVRRRALKDDLIRGDLVSDDGDGRPRSSSASTRTRSTPSAAASSSAFTTSSIRSCRRA